MNNSLKYANTVADLKRVRRGYGAGMLGWGGGGDGVQRNPIGVHIFYIFMINYQKIENAGKMVKSSPLSKSPKSAPAVRFVVK